jgi:ATP-dependent DNA helicase PIF1
VPMEYLNSQAPTGLPPHELRFKPGMPVMLLRNIDPHNTLCNGTRMIVSRLARDRAERVGV